jgi:arabinofuranan 3-O-arabinosyltransferase
VTLTYRPNTLYRDAIAGGFGTLNLVVIAALWPAPRRVRAPARRPRWLARPRWLRVPVRLRPGPAGALTAAAAVCGLLLAGLWLGGYPGAAILAGTAGLFTAAVSHWHRHRLWLELSRPWLVAGLLLAAAACAVVGGRLLAAGTSGPLVTALTNTAPQILCLAIVGRLAAALFASDP